MNVKITWQPYTSDPGDVTHVRVFRSDTLSSEQDFQNALDDNTAGDAVFETQDILNASEYTDTQPLAGDNYYCIAVTNSSGLYNVGADTPTNTVPNNSTSGAVAHIHI